MDSLEQWKEHMEDYGNKLKEQAARQSQKSEGVTISTLHSVKGCLLYTSPSPRD